MSFGKMNTFIDIISAVPVKDADGFVTHGDNILASVRAYKEDRNGSMKRANMTAFPTASALFRFRKLRGVDIVSSIYIVCEDGRYKVISAEDVKGCGMYWEVVAEKVSQ
jgi:hypothetical protein